MRAGGMARSSTDLDGVLAEATGALARGVLANSVGRVGPDGVGAGRSASIDGM